jgi:phenylacetate-CoA ligase
MVPARKVVGIIGPTELHGMVDTFTDVFQGLNCCVGKIYPFSTKVNFKKALEVLKKLRVEILCVTPTIALMLARAAMDNGFRLESDFALKKIFLTGELCSREMCRNVSSFWKATAINNPFASQESLAMAAGDMDGKLHTFPLSYVYELIDPQTEVSKYHSANGTADRVVRGELVVTMLEEGARPLLRYRSGDYVEIAPCSFANRPSVFLTPLGRVKDIIAMPGGVVRTAYEIEEAVLRPLQRILNYELALQPPTAKPTLKLDIELEPGRLLTAKEKTSVIESLRECTGVEAEIMQVEKGSGASNMSALAGWKAARFRDLTLETRDAEREYAEIVGSRRIR